MVTFLIVVFLVVVFVVAPIKKAFVKKKSMKMLSSMYCNFRNTVFNHESPFHTASGGGADTQKKTQTEARTKQLIDSTGQEFTSLILPSPEILTSSRRKT